MKKVLALILALMMLMLAGCGGGNGGGDSPNRPVASPPEIQQAPTQLTITFSNASAYNFNEIYITPTAQDDWGADLLGSTSLLKSNGSFEVSIPKYDFANYDIRVVDETKDTYEFTRVPLTNGAELAIYFGDDGLAVDVADSKGDVVGTVFGTLNGSSIGGSDAPEQPSNDFGTGYNTNGEFSFTVYNESDFDIFAIHMGSLNASSDADIDMLPQVLPAGESIDLSGTVTEDEWLNTEWTLYVTDVDGDTSSSFDTFNPWEISYVNIRWDSNAGGYVCDFLYYEAQ